MPVCAATISAEIIDQITPADPAPKAMPLDASNPDQRSAISHNQVGGVQDASEGSISAGCGYPMHGGDGHNTGMGLTIPNPTVQMFDCFCHLDDVNPHAENLKTRNVGRTPNLIPQKRRSRIGSVVKAAHAYVLLAAHPAPPAGCMFVPASCCAGSPEHSRDRQRQNFEIKPQRPAIDILHVQYHPLVERNAVSAGHLPQTGDSRRHAESPSMPILTEELIVTHR